VEEFKVKGATVNVVIQTISALMEWFIGHIKKYDKALAEYLRKNPA